MCGRCRLELWGGMLNFKKILAGSAAIAALLAPFAARADGPAKQSRPSDGDEAYPDITWGGRYIGLGIAARQTRSK